MENATPKTEPVLALNLYCLDSQKKIVDKLQEALEFIKSLTEKEFEGVHNLPNGVILKIIDLK